MKPISITTRITSRDSESFIKYLREVSDIKPFESSEAEYECALRSMNGDVKAKDELISRNLRFVVSCAKQYDMNGVTLEDLVNEGNIGMSIAADKFDPTQGFKFITYAVWYIKKEILTYLSNNSRTIRLPTNKVSAIENYRKNIDRLEVILERPVDDLDILEAYKEYTQDELDVLNSLLDNDTTSLDMQFGDDGVSLSELLEDSSMIRADDLVMKSDLEVNINALTSVLTDHEREILTRLYGLDGKAPETLASVGDSYEISRESVRQRRDKALRRMKDRFSGNVGQIFNM